MSEFLAHSANGEKKGVPEPLKTHLTRVADRAAEFASTLGLAQQAHAAGLLHDLGKYGDQFQRRVKGSNERARDHSSAGALVAVKYYKDAGLFPALAIEGHHIGLQKLETWKNLQERIGRKFKKNACPPESESELTETDLDVLSKPFGKDGFKLPDITDGIRPTDKHNLANMLDVRMFFSTLVDADFLETEAHFNGDANVPVQPRPPGPTLEPAQAFRTVCREIDRLAGSAKATPELLDVRRMLYEDCRRKAVAQQPGLFTLSAPTGSGKTLSMLAFALQHAATHGLRRVIVVMPYLSIIDQTAKIYRELFSKDTGFPPNFVIEDHSNATPEKRSNATPEKKDDADSVEAGPRLDRLLAENWDAPIVLTTSVQCLESLMGNRPSACRKLHRLAKSVILFDEVQTIPRHLVVPALATLSRLCERFGSSVVFSTATQPAFDHLHDAVKHQAKSGWRPTEITSAPEKLFVPSASRIKVHWCHDQALAWETLADRIEKGEELTDPAQVLCIVNLKRHASDLAQSVHGRVEEGTLHLSTNMCPEHRGAVLEEVRRRLEEHLPVRLIATQCIEAGVDIDFPVVHRAFGPLDSIAQAAGRCNRGGKQPNGGTLHVFKPQDDSYPQGGYKQAVDATRSFLKQLRLKHDLDSLNVLNDPRLLRCYYKQLYGLSGTGNEKGALADAIEACDFADVAKEFRLIKSDTINIVVPYDRDSFERLRAETEDEAFHNPDAIRKWIRNARPHTVSLNRPRDPDSLLWNVVEPVQFSGRKDRSNDEASWFMSLSEAKYDSLVGWCGGDDRKVY